MRRTRSIIAAQSLIDAGVPNRVVALRIGTIGWTLAGLPLDVGDTPRVDLSSAPVAAASARATAVATRAEVGAITAVELDAALAVGRRTIYRFDVRSRDEHVGGHPDGFTWAPGGQLVQETDVFAPVRGALFVLYADAGVRADMAASWLAQMGWDVRVLRSPPVLVHEAHRPRRAGVPEVDWRQVAGARARRRPRDLEPAVRDASDRGTRRRYQTLGRWGSSTTW